MIKLQRKDYSSKSIIPPIHAQLTKSISEKYIKDYIIPNSLQIKLNKQNSKYKTRFNQTPISDKSTCSNNTSSIVQKYSQDNNKLYISRNVNTSHQMNHQLASSSHFDFKSNVNHRIVVKRIFLDKQQQSKFDNSNTNNNNNQSNTFCDISQNTKQSSPKFKKKIISLMKHPNAKYINPVSMNNSLQKEHSNSPIGCYKKPIKLNSSMDNMSVNISKINKITLISKAVSPICTTKNNIRNNNINNNQSRKSCDDFSFEDAEGPEDMHFVFVKLFQKKKVFYEKLVEKIEKNKELDIEHNNNSNDFFTYE